MMDDKQRIALVETQTVDNGATVSSPAQAQRYQFANHLGSACLELDENGGLISYEEYSPYGNTTYQAGRSGAEVSLKRYRYTGMERDEENGFTYHGARYYAPWLGRWTSCDRVGITDGANIYLYTKGNPLRLVDTEGSESGASKLVELPKAQLRKQNSPVDTRKKADAGAAKARKYANSSKKNPGGIGRPQPGDEMAHMSAARHNKVSDIPNDIANDPGNIKAMPAKGKNARVTNPDGTFRDTDFHAAQEDLLDEIQRRNQHGKTPGTLEFSVAAQDAMQEAKIKSEYMTREHLDQVKAGGPARPEKGPPVDPATGKVILEPRAPPSGTAPPPVEATPPPAEEPPPPKASLSGVAIGAVVGAALGAAYSLLTTGKIDANDIAAGAAIGAFPIFAVAGAKDEGGVAVPIMLYFGGAAAVKTLGAVGYAAAGAVGYPAAVVAAPVGVVVGTKVLMGAQTTLSHIGGWGSLVRYPGGYGSPRLPGED